MSVTVPTLWLVLPFMALVVYAWILVTTPLIMRATHAAARWLFKRRYHLSEAEMQRIEANGDA